MNATNETSAAAPKKAFIRRQKSKAVTLSRKAARAAKGSW